MARIETFAFRPERILGRKYQVIKLLGTGWESEVYLVRETATGIERTAKFFFPQRNERNRTAQAYAKKLHKLRHCPVVIQYASQEVMRHEGHDVTFLISEYVEGELLSSFIKRQPGGRLGAFQALHLLHALAKALEPIHRLNEYHGDLHADNIIIQRTGLGFELKLIDVHLWGDTRAQNIQSDIVNLIHVFHEALGGARHYARLPQAIKDILSGLKASLILKKFRSASQLTEYLETLLEWDDPRPSKPRKRKKKRKKKKKARRPRRKKKKRKKKKKRVKKKKKKKQRRGRTKKARRRAKKGRRRK
ncbi:MAG TPA: protein kinase [Bdellovibrionota bacterium]|nr:protein kinase [Bdellovibrionota bacterium]